MFPYVAFRVECWRLFDTAQAIYLGQDFRNKTDCSHYFHSAARTTAREEFRQFVSDTLGADTFYLESMSLYGTESIGINCVPKVGGKTDSAKHS
jgi:hypothetical protein